MVTYCTTRTVVIWILDFYNIATQCLLLHIASWRLHNLHGYTDNYTRAAYLEILFMHLWAIMQWTQGLGIWYQDPGTNCYKQYFVELYTHVDVYAYVFCTWSMANSPAASQSPCTFSLWLHAFKLLTQHALFQ